MLPAELLFLFLQSVLVEKNGNNKRTECLSNDSAVLTTDILTQTAISLS